MFSELEEFEPQVIDASPLAEHRRNAVRVGRWRGWLAACAARYVPHDYAPHHVKFWEWVWSIEDGVRPEPAAAVNIWSRSHTKSTSAELAVAALAARSKRKYIVYVCDTQNQSDQHVSNVGTVLESPEVHDVYPTVGQRLVNSFGYSEGWRRSQLRSAAGFSVEAYGLDSAQRGAKIDEYRPDLIIFDDIDNPEDSEETIQKKIDILTKGLLPTGSRWCAVLGVQNLITPHGIFARIASGEADFLQNKYLSGPIPAVEDLVTDIQPNDEGVMCNVVIGGEPTWCGYTLKNAQDDIDMYGLNAFLVEFQHEVGGGGNMFPADQWVELDALPTCSRYVRAWDLAGTVKGDWTVGIKMGRHRGKFYVVDIVRRRVLSGDLRDFILKTARADGKGVRVVLPKDPGQAGLYQAGELGKGLAGYSVFPEPQTGSKMTKAEPMSGNQQLGNIYVPKGAPWLESFRFELKQFPNGRWDDQVDAAASAYNRLTQIGEGRTGFSSKALESANR